MEKELLECRVPSREAAGDSENQGQVHRLRQGVRMADGRRWRTAGMGGEVDHIVPLCKGGTNDPANLALRCKSCHGLKDAKLRRKTT